ncbi:MULTISPECIES: NAD-dependent succinate-semialdehyde dehydrogenase [unclassified Sporosarcina]|uniref:NAD-dependent succinate-semialdehyde dehydrogenase n=1 Tax=unclassified Sporosarcina TaxID=2647733 RepID=UPI000C16AA5C|nr:MULTISPECIES: NAD-dependent succinate-semialdehyde dehydrogenase [unclassified Sporosarcina]PID05690.1 succinate-semialdehyde dehydrogenase (NADP(+)) [Sporosarcina sp. P30]PID08884.1 succinate-semialdehyde dehydrogenase (NADP(+)) [Sporosarcina sp. P31]PID11875.1 succinate-semialdehyde dehydrogenase (NADP(+)) [Sporosarcina sp. P32b]
MYINGEWLKTESELEIKNPATGEIVDTVYLVGKTETKRAIDAAKEAFPLWSGLTSEERSNHIHNVVAKLEEKKEHLAQVITREMGKSIHNARYEVGSTISFFKWYAEEARRVYGDVMPISTKNKRAHVIKQPVGVVAAITPWNFPLSMGARKLGPALAVGCTVVLKPSSEAPLSSLELFKIFDEAGLPKGVVNLVIGKSEEIAQIIMDSKDVRKITFTGSTEVGKHLIRQSADTVKQISMELGGHAPFIVFDDADLDLAVQGVIGSKFASSGQQCVCTNRVYVQEAVYEEFAEKFKTAVGKMKVGNGLDETNQMGSLVNEKAVNSVHSQVVDAVDKGAKVLVGGKKLKGNEYSKGYFYAPTVLGNVTEDMDITKVETFGPVAPLISFVTEAEAVQKANDIEYGLASYFYTNDLSRVHRVSEKLEYGMVGVNDSAPFSMQAPFGGIKESGLGRESGKYGLEDYLTTKAVSVMFNTEEG